MRLTNKQLGIVVDEIFQKISQPIIDKNKEIEDNIILSNEPIMKDKVKYDKIMAEAKEVYKQYEAIKDRAYRIVDKYRGKNLNGIKISDDKYLFDNNSYSYNGKNYKAYLEKRKENLSKEKALSFPSRKDIERKVILSGNKDIIEIIKTITDEFIKTRSSS